MNTTEQITSRTVETLAVNYGPKLAIVGGASAAVGGLTLTELLSVGGFILALAGTVATIFFGWRRDRRESAEHRERLQKIRNSEIVDRRSGAPDLREDKFERRQRAPNS